MKCVLWDLKQITQGCASPHNLWKMPGSHSQGQRESVLLIALLKLVQGAGVGSFLGLTTPLPVQVSINVPQRAIGTIPVGRGMDSSSPVLMEQPLLSRT